MLCKYKCMVNVRVFFFEGGGGGGDLFFSVFYFSFILFQFSVPFCLLFIPLALVSIVDTWRSWIIVKYRFSLFQEHRHRKLFRCSPHRINVSALCCLAGM